MRCICGRNGEALNIIQDQPDINLIRQMYNITVLPNQLLCTTCWDHFISLRIHQSKVYNRLVRDIDITNSMCYLCTDIGRNNADQYIVDLIRTIHKMNVPLNHLLCWECWTVLNHVASYRPIVANFQTQPNRDRSFRAHRSNRDDDIVRTPPTDGKPRTPGTHEDESSNHSRYSNRKANSLYVLSLMNRTKKRGNIY